MEHLGIRFIDFLIEAGETQLLKELYLALAEEEGGAPL